ncbi:MAG: hypothetical protein ACM32J_11980 [Rhizobacter sp.]
MSSEFTARQRLFEVEEHVEIGEAYLATQQARLAEYLARGEDPVQLARMMQVMQDLLDGLRVRRARAAADVLTLDRGRDEGTAPFSRGEPASTSSRPVACATDGRRGRVPTRAGAPS